MNDTTRDSGEPLESDVVEAFETFWRDIVRPNGVWDLNQVKRELYDYRLVLTEVPKVYDEITRGAISKPNTKAEDVIGVHDERCWHAQDASRLRRFVEQVAVDFGPDGAYRSGWRSDGRDLGTLAQELLDG